MTKGEILTVTRGYIGVNSGYLGDFSYRTHEEFYPMYCELEINPLEFEGTTRQRFETILETVDNVSQAKILIGVLKKYPVAYFPEAEHPRKRQLEIELRSIIARLQGQIPITKPTLNITSDIVERAIADTAILVEKNGPQSGVDRIHTALHGYLKAVCSNIGITVDEFDSLTNLFSKLKQNHPSLQGNGARQEEIDQIIRSFSNVLDKLNPIRNKASVAHPNDQILEKDEALFVINAAQTILHYLNSKFK